MPATEEEIEQIANLANELLGSLDDTIRLLDIHQLEFAEEVKQIKELYAPSYDQYVKRISELREQIRKLVMPHINQLVRVGTQTIYLRNGEIAFSRGQESLVNAEGVSDDEAIAEIRKLRGINRFTRRGKLTLNRDALTAAPTFVDRLRSLYITRRPTLRIRPAKVQGEMLKRQKDRLTIYLPKED